MSIKGIRRRIAFASHLIATSPSERNQAWRVLIMAARGIDIRGVSVADLGLDETRAHWYSDSGGADLHRVVRTLGIKSTDSVLDIGCGKGGALIDLSRFPFDRVDGVEISPRLVAIARRNLKKLGIANAEVYCYDAADFTDLDRYTYLYMFNPFPEAVVRSVFRNVRASLRGHPRQVILVYKNPKCDQVVRDSGFRPIKEFRHSALPFVVYRASAAQ